MGNDSGQGETMRVPSTNPVVTASHVGDKPPEKTVELIRRLNEADDHKKSHGSHNFFEIEEKNSVIIYRAYESIRNSIEYTEEHLLMRGAIARFLRRSQRTTDSMTLTEHLLTELTYAGYLKNRTVSDTTVQEVSSIIETYRRITEAGQVTSKKNQKTLIAILSAHIKDILAENERNQIIIDFVYDYCATNFTRPGYQNWGTTLYIGIERVLFKSDDATIFSRLFRRMYADHMATQPEAIAVQYVEFLNTLEDIATGRETREAMALMRHESAALLVLIDILHRAEKPNNLIEPSKIRSSVQSSAQSLYHRADKRLGRSIIRSILFLFITKALIGFAFEIPYDIATHGAIKVTPLVINLLFPPLYLLLISLTISQPDTQNTEQVYEKVSDILLTENTAPEKKNRDTRSSAAQRIYDLLYLSVSFIIMYGLVQLLFYYEFNIASITIFFIYFSSVSFFGFRITHIVRELKVFNRRNSGLLNNVITIITTPFVRVGQWLSARYKGINLFVFFFDFLIEAPLKSIIGFYSKWTSFLREKQDETL